VYQIEGISSGVLTATQIPVAPCEQNGVETIMKAKITDLSEGSMEASVSKSAKGADRFYYQHHLMDIYHYQEEEKKKVPDMKDTFSQLPKTTARKMAEKKTDYMSARKENFEKRLKELVKNDYDLTVDDASELKILQAGRFDDTPEFKYEYVIKMKGAVKKAGPNYLVDIGKLIEGQVQIMNEERERSYNIYQPNAHNFDYRVELEIPAGYTVQGLDKLNSQVDNETGGFKSTARMEGKTLIVETRKSYKSNYQKKEDWKKIVAFLDAAYNFTQNQILLKKI
jgi:hypothetical protein